MAHQSTKRSYLVVVDASASDDALTISCGDCPAAETDACADCLVTVLLSRRPVGAGSGRGGVHR